MAQRLNALADRAAGAAFGLTNYDNLEADVNYLVVPGGDLASAATVTIDHHFHGITGTTTINNIADALGLVAGQKVELWIKNGPVVFSASAGNIKTVSGRDYVALPNEVVEFTFDGTDFRLNTHGLRLIGSGQKAAGVSTTGTTFGTGADILASAISFTADGVSTYVLSVNAEGISINNTGFAVRLAPNLDGAQDGEMAIYDSATTSYHVPLTAWIPLVPGAGAHTINARVFTSGGTAAIAGGAGGAANPGPILVCLWRLP